MNCQTSASGKNFSFTISDEHAENDVMNWLLNIYYFTNIKILTINLPSKVTSSPPAFRLSFFSIIQSSAQSSIVSQKKSPGFKKNNTLTSMYVFMLHLFHCIGILSGFIRLSKKDNTFYIFNSTTTTILTMTQTLWGPWPWLTKQNESQVSRITRRGPFSWNTPLPQIN